MYNLESGINQRGERYRFSTNAYLMYFVDEIVPSGGLDQFGVPRTGNADRTIHIGLESEINARLYAGLDLQANLAVSRNRFQKFTEYDEFTGEAFDRAGNPIAGFPNITSNVAVTYSKRGATIRVSSQFVGSQNIDNSGVRNSDGVESSEFEVDPYSLTNATLIYRFDTSSALSGLEASFDVNNVFDSKVLTWGNVSFGSPQFFPYATRHVYVKMKYTLR
jgi:iron complex outermembrane receptor protein